MLAFLHEAATFGLRWLHVVAAIAWIGESFYFVMLDRGLAPPKTPLPGLAGESWSVHGGGFYHKQKYLPAPAELPAELHWSKWKSYTTWLSGFALLCALYFAAPGVWLLDPARPTLSPGGAIGAALALLAGGWLGYDLICRLAGARDRLLGIAVALLVAAIAWLALTLFAPRAAFLLTGATLATIMSANVFFVIIPGQKRMVAQLARGEAADPEPGRRGKQRSVHNTYFTLPVVFCMLSAHFAAAWSHPQAFWLLLAFMAAGAAIRQFFVLWHGGARAWWLLGLAAVLIVAALLVMAPAARAPAPAEPAAPAPIADADRDDTGPTFSSTPSTAELLPVFVARCSGCHGATPTLMPSAPKGLLFDQPAVIDAHAAEIARQVVELKIMPPGNLTRLGDDERAAIGRWAAARTP